MNKMVTILKTMSQVESDKIDFKLSLYWRL